MIGVARPDSGASSAKRDPLRFHRGHRNKGAFGEGFVPRMAEKVADAMGTVQSVLISTTVILAWILINHVTRFPSNSWHGLRHGEGFDPAPFILLNPVFSALAYYSASMARSPRRPRPNATWPGRRPTRSTAKISPTRRSS